MFDSVVAIDREGIELPDLNAAYENAVFQMRSMIADRVQIGHLATDLCIKIADDDGTDLAVVTFRDAVAVPHETSTGR